MESNRPFQIEPLDPAKHDRSGFDCGVPALNDYLARQANQDRRRSAAGCWVLTEAGKPGRILGYYTLASEAIDAVDLPEIPKRISRKLPPYRRFGTALIGRLAVTASAQAQGIGRRLLFDAITRCLASEIPFAVVVVDPKDDRATSWYSQFGFRLINARRMAITLTELLAYFAG